MFFNDVIPDWNELQQRLMNMSVEDLHTVDLKTLDQNTNSFVSLFRGHYQKYKNVEFARRYALNSLKRDIQPKNGRFVASLVCPRCSGTGVIPQFAHFDDGRCYLCGGKGIAYIKLSVFTDDTIDREQLQTAFAIAFKSLFEQDRIDVWTKDDLDESDLIIRMDEQVFRVIAHRFHPARGNR